MSKVLIFDIDGTLIARGKTLIEESAVKAIRECHEKGHKILIASGRGYYAMQQDVKDRVPADYLITVNGNCINTSDGTVVRYFGIRQETADELVRELLENDFAFGIKFPDSFQIYNQFEYFAGRYCSGTVTRDQLVDASATRDYHLTHPALDFFIYSKDNAAWKIVEAHEDIKVVNAFNAPDCCECFSIDSNKGKSIEMVVRDMGYAMEDCIAFGDSQNDEEMLAMCGIGVAMGNASEYLKQKADYVTADILDDGIEKAIRHLNLI